MTAIALRVLELMRRTEPSRLDRCALCGRALPAGEAALRLDRGRQAHRRCATYRMRRQELLARRLR